MIELSQTPEVGISSGLDLTQRLFLRIEESMNSEAIKVACSNCNLRELCMPMGLSDHDLNRLDELVTVRRKIKRGSTLFSNGEKFTSLYAIRTGFF